MKKQIAFLLCFCVLLPQAFATIDSLKAIVQSKVHDTLRVRAMIGITEQTLGQDNAQSFEFANKALELSKTKNYLFGQSEAHYYLGLLSYYTGSYAPALMHYDEAFILKQKLGDVKTQANLLLLKALIYENISNAIQAQDHLFRSLELFEILDDTQAIGVCYDNIGISFMNQKEFEKGLEYFLKSNEIAVKLENPSLLAVSYNNLYKAYDALGEKEKARQSLLQSIDICKKHNNLHALSIAYNNMGKWMFENKLFQEAQKYYELSIEIKEGLNNKLGLSTTFNNLGELNLDRNRTDASLSYYQKALGLAKEVGSLSEQRTATKGLMNVYRRKNDFLEAMRYMDFTLLLNDSISNQEKARHLASLEAQYQNEKKQQEITTLKHQNELHLSELRQQRTLLFSALLLIITIGGSTVMVLLMYRNKRRANYLLQEQNIKIVSQKEEIETQNEVLAQQSVMLNELNQVRSKFFANISHELKTPLTLIVSPLSQALENDGAGMKPGSIELMHRNACHLQQMIEELLELARMERSAYAIERQPIAISTFLNDLVLSFGSYALENQVKVLATELDEAMIEADTEAFRKACSNLISNAIKFSPQGGDVVVEGRVERDKYLIRVSDQGRGIPENELDAVFGRFYRASNSGFIKGSGIGLSIAKEIVELHEGTLTVENRPEGGAVFTLTLPLKKGEELLIDGKADAITGDEIQKGLKPKVLIVEDNKDMRSFIGASLDDIYELVYATNGAEGLKSTQEHLPDLIVSDVMMPVMDGFAFCREVKSNLETSHIPVILLTAKSSEQSIVAGLEMNADLYMTKPFGVSHLRAAIASQLRIRRQLREKFAGSLDVLASEVTCTSMDARFLEMAVNIIEQNLDDSEFNVEGLAKALNMGRSSVHRKITAITGLSTSEFMRNLRLKHAARMLKAQAGTISEIAYSVGFSDVSYFSKCFKKLFNQTPGEFAEKGKDRDNQGDI